MSHTTSSGLTVTAIGFGKYHVTGGNEDHWVNLVEIDVPRCDCAHHTWKDAHCRHIKAAEAVFNGGKR